jgi:hypothetical protein
MKLKIVSPILMALRLHMYPQCSLNFPDLRVWELDAASRIALNMNSSVPSVLSIGDSHVNLCPSYLTWTTDSGGELCLALSIPEDQRRYLGVSSSEARGEPDSHPEGDRCQQHC